MSDAIMHGERHERILTAAAAVAAGEVWQLPDGRAAVCPAAAGIASGDPAGFVTQGVFTLTKAASVVLLDGQEVYWDHSANAVTFKRNNDRDFFVGTMVGDAASAAVTCKVNLNVHAEYAILFGRDNFTNEATLGLGVTDLVGTPGVKLEFDAVAEAAQAAIFSDATVDHLANAILEAWVAIYGIGDNAALDITVGLASGSHATDFQSVANFVAIHLDSPGLSILVESDDGTTDVAPVDSLIDAVDDTPFFLQIDLRNPADVQVYVDGVDAVPAGTTLVATAMTNELKIIAHIEKTSDDTVADVRLLSASVRTAEQ